VIRSYGRLLHLGSATATAILLLFKFEVLSPEQFTVLYEPFAWCCYHIPDFVETHELWIEIAAAGLGVWKGLRNRQGRA
jgi:hypothetical protein